MGKRADPNEGDPPADGQEGEDGEYKPKGPSKKLQQTQAQVDEVVEIMKVNLDKVLERDQKLSSLDDRADALQEGAQQFEKQAATLKNKMFWKNMKMTIIIVVVVLIIAIVMFRSYIPSGAAAAGAAAGAAGGAAGGKGGSPEGAGGAESGAGGGGGEGGAAGGGGGAAESSPGAGSGSEGGGGESEGSKINKAPDSPAEKPAAPAAGARRRR